MTTIAVTAATGPLGRLVVAALLDRGVAAESIIAAVRSPEKAADLAAQGVQVRRADYAEPDTLVPALQGAERVLLISGTPGNRLVEHGNVIAAAKEVGVELLAYTGILNSDTTTMLLAADHKATEQLIKESGLPYAFLRNGWYTENSLMELETTLEHGFAGATGGGRFTPAARADFAAAAAAVLTDHADATNVAYELGGDEAVTMDEVAEILGEVTGRTIANTDMPAEQYAGVLVQAGLPEPVAQVLADASAAIGRGELATGSGDLQRLIGRPSTPVKTTFQQALAAKETTT
ncbi:MAG TPA: SDR family oxidoreductase [Solirubrobacteraceae bacterium]|nr:SDR family oxidoreductase [Solirubrobacteraceae bacterium]